VLPASAKPTFQFEARLVPIEDGDTLAVALYRSGVRTFSRSFKYHRPRGLYCLSGDCPNCLLNVDGEACVRACMTPARPDQVVRRENGWPSVGHDVLRVADWLRWLLPVGFYYKTLLRPRWLWPMVEPLLRRAAGLGTAMVTARRSPNREARHRHVDVLVIGAGVAGLSAALSASEAGQSVLLCDEGTIGAQLPPGPARDAVLELASVVIARPATTVLERTPAIGVYEGPLVPLNAPDQLEIVHPARVVVATGAVEQHRVFPGNDLPGVLLSRAAARLAACHRIHPGKAVVAVIETEEGCTSVQSLMASGVNVVATVIPSRLAALLPSGVTKIIDGRLVRAEGRGRVRVVVVEAAGRHQRLRCDTLVLSLGFQPRDGLLYQGEGQPVVGVGDVVRPGCSLDVAIQSGRDAVNEEPPLPIALPNFAAVEPPKSGFVCLCEDVSAADLRLAWREGFASTELLKRYTTVAMGPCQGVLCQAHLQAFAVDQVDGESYATVPTTARPPSRPITLEQVSAGMRELVEQRTALDARHLALGARLEPTGAWRRPSHYGDVTGEYHAVRSGVSIMDVSTLGKFLVAGPDAATFLDRLYPCRVADLTPGRIRYSLLLAETGFVFDDGLICAVDGSSWYLTLTSGGAEHAEGWLRDWIDTWELDVHLVNLTAGLGAINVAGPKARDLLRILSDDQLDNEGFPYGHYREIEVAGISCRAIRVGFVGELSFELHHASSRSVQLWDALLDSGSALGVRPHGLEALRLLRLEKGHIIVGQDTDYDSTPDKLGMSWAAKMDKPTFVGKRALERIAKVEPVKRLVPIRFDDGAPSEGCPLSVDGEYVGYLTSSRASPQLGFGVSLGWISRHNGAFPATVVSGGLQGTIVDQSFYDPKGERLRA
jgi:sarcosine oxidase subunit alpha